MLRNLFILITALVITGCGSFNSGVGEKIPSDEGTGAVVSGINGVYSGGGGYNPGVAMGDNAATTGNFYDNPQYGKNVTAGPKSVAKDRVIYFLYDSANIDSRAESIITAHANYLLSHPNTKILLEGHTDSRGSREYNIALGERRAISVLKRFQALRVPLKQIRIISYGEEKPAVSGYSEDSFQRNRRAVIQY